MSEDNIFAGCAGLILLGLFVFLGGFHYSSTRGGEHSGFVTAIESTGIIWQNWRVYFKTDNSSSQEDVYCLPRESTELLAKLKEASTQRKQVTINYEGMRKFEYGVCNKEYITEVN